MQRTYSLNLKYILCSQRVRYRKTYQQASICLTDLSPQQSEATFKYADLTQESELYKSMSQLTFCLGRVTEEKQNVIICQHSGSRGLGVCARRMELHVGRVHYSFNSVWYCKVCTCILSYWKSLSLRQLLGLGKWQAPKC